MLVTAIRPDAELYRSWRAVNNAPFWTLQPTLEHFRDLMAKTMFPRWLWNTFYIAVASTGISLACGLLAGYALARLRFPMAGMLGTSIFVTYLVPPTLLFIPLADIIRDFQLGNTPWALILTYPTFLIPFCTWLLMGYFKTIPKELEECARIDGATRFGAMTRIIVPIAVPGILSAGIFAFTLSWNEFIYALIFLSSPERKTVPVGVVSELIRGDIYFWGQLMAGALLGSIPVALVYSFFVEYYVTGLTGSVKGLRERERHHGAGDDEGPQQEVRRGARRQGREPPHPRQGVHRPRRPLGVRQIDDAPDGRGARGDHGGRDHDRRPGRQRSSAEGPRHRHGVPELRALPAHDRLRQHGLRPEDAEVPEGRDPEARAGRGRDPRHPGAPQAQAPAALRRPAAAGRGRARDRASPAGVPLRRAALQPGCQAPRPDARRAEAAPRAARDHRHLRDPRSGRGDDARRSGRRHEGRLDPAGRRAARAVREAGEQVRRRVHRLARDELRRREGRRRQRHPLGRGPGAAREGAAHPHEPPRALQGTAGHARRPARRPPIGLRERPERVRLRRRGGRRRAARLRDPARPPRGEQHDRRPGRADRAPEGPREDAAGAHARPRALLRPQDRAGDLTL